MRDKTKRKSLSHNQIWYGHLVGEWVWCLHCGRAYKAGESRFVDGYTHCPYDDCNGGPWDAFSWDWLTIENKPVEPKRWVIYYPKGV